MPWVSVSVWADNALVMRLVETVVKIENECFLELLRLECMIKKVEVIQPAPDIHAFIYLSFILHYASSAGCDQEMFQVCRWPQKIIGKWHIAVRVSSFVVQWWFFITFRIFSTYLNFLDLKLAVPFSYSFCLSCDSVTTIHFRMN